MKEISLKDLEKMEESYLKDEKAKVVRRALYKNSIETISRVMEADKDTTDIFSIDIQTMPVTEQLRSGRCWIFAACNVMREALGRKYDIKEIELSQNYLAFYDKLEKINLFLEIAIKEKEEDLGSETLRYVLDMGIGDGGQWNMLASVVKKYGVVTKNAMGETYQAGHTNEMNRLINQRLRKFAAYTKKYSMEEVLKEKEKTLNESYRLLCNCFGVPPKTFDFEYRDKDNNYHVYKDITPKEFYKDYLEYNLDEYVGIIHGPTKDKPYHELYTVKYLGNVVNGDPVRFLNLPMNEFKELVIKQMKDNQIVWFGCDCSFLGDRELGVWDDNQFDYNNTFDIDFDMSKEEMLDTRNSAMNHAMCFTGVNLIDDKPNRFKIENSWGDKIARKGYFVCSDSWFEKFVYQAVVNKKYLNEKQLECLSKEPIELLPWDPFGTLA